MNGMISEIVKIALIVVVTLVPASCRSDESSLFGHQSQWLVECYRHVLPSIVTVRGDVPNQWGDVEHRGMGTGFFITDEYVLTVYHVAKAGTNLEIVLWDKTVIRADMHAVDSRNDLAILRIDPNEVRFYNIPEFDFETNPQIGEVIFVVGSPFLFDGTMTVGILSRKTTRIPRWDCDVYLVDVAVNGGNSGSPVFDAKFRAIGIVKGYCGSFAVVIPSYSIRCFLRATNL